jgi:hypothetical protein
MVFCLHWRGNKNKYCYWILSITPSLGCNGRFTCHYRRERTLDKPAYYRSILHVHITGYVTVYCPLPIHHFLTFIPLPTFLLSMLIWIKCFALLILKCGFKFANSNYQLRGPGSSVGIATGYGLGGPGIESRWGWDFPHLSRPALGPTQPPVQWVLWHPRG